MYEVKRVTTSHGNRSMFRQIARDTSGETFDVPERDRLLFVYKKKDKSVVAVACYQAAWCHLKEPSSDTFLDHYYHILTYMFVKPYYKGQGIGSSMLRFIQKEMMVQAKRPIRVQSAGRATGFFQHHGYVATGDVTDCVCSGSPLFSTIVNMVKSV